MLLHKGFVRDRSIRAALVCGACDIREQQGLHKGAESKNHDDKSVSRIMKNSHHTCDPKCGRTKGLGVANPRTIYAMPDQGGPSWTQPKNRKEKKNKNHVDFNVRENTTISLEALRK